MLAPFEWRPYELLSALPVCRKSDRLDWMYQGGMLARAEAEKRNEEAMLAGKPVTLGTAADEGSRVSDYTRGSFGGASLFPTGCVFTMGSCADQNASGGVERGFAAPPQACAIGRLTYTTCS